MPAQISSSALAVPSSRIRQIAELAMSMEGVSKLYFGESNVPTPDFIKRAAQKAMADGYTFYTENAGLPSLRRALARYYSELHGVELDPSSEIAVTASGVQALNVALREVPCVLEGRRYAIDFDALERAVSPRTRLLIYTSPSNPLGTTATGQEQEKLLDFARRHELWLMADEVYERIYYPGLAEPAEKGKP